MAFGTCALVINIDCYDLQKSGLVKSNSKYFVVRECFYQNNQEHYDRLLHTTKFQIYDLQKLRNMACHNNALVAEFEVYSVTSK